MTGSPAQSYQDAKRKIFTDMLKAKAWASTDSLARNPKRGYKTQVGSSHDDGVLYTEMRENLSRR